MLMLKIRYYTVVILIVSSQATSPKNGASVSDPSQEVLAKDAKPPESGSFKDQMKECYNKIRKYVGSEGIFKDFYVKTGTSGGTAAHPRRRCCRGRSCCRGRARNTPQRRRSSRDDVAIGGYSQDRQRDRDDVKVWCCCVYSKDDDGSDERASGADKGPASGSVEGGDQDGAVGGDTDGIKPIIPNSGGTSDSNVDGNVGFHGCDPNTGSVGVVDPSTSGDSITPGNIVGDEVLRGCCMWNPCSGNDDGSSATVDPCAMIPSINCACPCDEIVNGIGTLCMEGLNLVVKGVTTVGDGFVKCLCWCCDPEVICCCFCCSGNCPLGTD